MQRQSLVEEAVVGGEQFGDRPVLAQDAADEQLDLAPVGATQVFVEIREQRLVRIDVVEPLDVQPLVREVRDQLGHSTYAVIDRYAQLNTDGLREAHVDSSPVDRMK